MFNITKTRLLPALLPFHSARSGPLPNKTRRQIPKLRVPVEAVDVEAPDAVDVAAVAVALPAQRR